MPLLYRVAERPRTTTAIVIFLVLLMIVAAYKPDLFGQATGVCETGQCLIESAKILEVINRTANPCENLYEFACGNHSKNAEKEDKLNMEEYREKKLTSIYMEKVTVSEHKMLQTAKELFRACLDEVHLEMEELDTFKEVLKEVGGWPVLDPNWNEDNFNWINATLKLRELGYYYNIFLEVSVQPHPNKSNDYILEVLMKSFIKQANESQLLETMVDVAETFGAQDRSRVEEEMKKAVHFWKNLNQVVISHDTSGIAYSINEYNDSFTEEFDWFKFIQTMVESGDLIIASDQKVLFSPSASMSSWIRLIERFPKRDQANYMMWMVIQNTVPFFSKLRELQGVEWKTHKKFCVDVVDHSFAISPIRLVALDRHLSSQNPQKRKKVDDFLNYISKALIDILYGLPWVHPMNIDNYAGRLISLKAYVEKPKEMSVYQVFVDQMVDLVPPTKITFLNLFARVNRNSHSLRFHSLKEESELKHFWVKWPKIHDKPYFDPNTFKIYIPGCIFQRYFNENRPQYLNYGAMGAFVGEIFRSLFDTYHYYTWPHLIRENYLTKTRAVMTALNHHFSDISEYIREEPSPKVSNLIATFMGHKIAYKAYKHWVEKNGEEAPLFANTYTSNQLYWISAANVYCAPIEDNMVRLSSLDVLNVAIGEIVEYDRDFNCVNSSVFKNTGIYKEL